MSNKKSQVRGAVDVAAQTRKKSGFYNLLLMLLGVVAMVLLGAFFYLSPFFNKKTEPPLNQAVEVVPLPEQKPDSTYQFYEILPEQKFRSAPEGVGVQEETPELPKELHVDAVVKADAPKEGEITIVEEETTYDDPAISIDVAKSDVTYILQIRTYDNADEADIKRGEVLMAGVDARVVKRSDDNGTLYQVVSVAMNSRDEAMTAYNRLQTNGIDSVVVEQKHR